MLLIRFGLLFLLLIRVFVLFPRLKQTFSGDAASQDVDGVPMPFEYRVSRNSKSKRVTDIHLGQDVPDRVRFRIQRETAFDRFAKALGVAQEWQTQDRAFDAKAYLLSDDAVLLTALSRNVALREAVMALLDEPQVNVIRCSHGMVWIEADYSAPREVRDIDVARELAKTILPKLARVRQELQSLSSDIWNASRDPGLRKQSIVLNTTLVLGVLGLLAFFWPEGLNMPRQVVVDSITTHALQLSVAAGIIVTVAVWALMGRGSRLHWVLVEVFLIGVPGLWFIATTASELQNQRYDVSRTEIREVRVDDKFERKGRKSSRHYYLTVSGWPDTRVSSEFEVTGATYSLFTPPTCAHVRWHAGSLGDPWISDMAPSECGDLAD